MPKDDNLEIQTDQCEDFYQNSTISSQLYTPTTTVYLGLLNLYCRLIFVYKTNKFVYVRTRENEMKSFSTRIKMF
jgi:hypothetical protein